MGQPLVKGKAHGLGRGGTTVRLRPSNPMLSGDKMDKLLNASKPQFHHLLEGRIIIIITIAPVPGITVRMQGDKLCRAQDTQWVLVMVATIPVLLSLSLPLPSACLPHPSSPSPFISFFPASFSFWNNGITWVAWSRVLLPQAKCPWSREEWSKLCFWIL